MLTLEPLSNKHLHEFIPINEQSEEFTTICDIMYNNIDEHNFCFLDKGSPVLLLGMKQKWLGVYDTYTIFSDMWHLRHYRRVIRVVKGYFENLEYDRIEHLVKCDRPWTHKMAKAFGFKCETPDGLKKYVNGKDYYMYSIVSEDGA